MQLCNGMELILHCAMLLVTCLEVTATAEDSRESVEWFNLLIEQIVYTCDFCCTHMRLLSRLNFAMKIASVN